MKTNEQIAAGYCRVSTKGQVNKISLPDQKKQIKDYCKQFNFNLLTIYVEKGFSGSTDDRPEYRKMLRDAAQQKFSVLVVTDSDRFGRSVEDRLRIRSILVQDFNIELHSIADGVFKDSATGKFQDTIKASVSEYYRDLQIEKSTSAIRYKLEKGERNIARTFYGLKWAPDKKSAIHHPIEYPNVIKVIELRIKKRWSYAAIAEHLNKKNIEYKKGNKWTWHKVGYICSRNAETYSKGQSIVTYEDQKYDYVFPPLISELELLQLAGISPDFIIKGRPKIQYMLSHKLVCGLFGTNLHHHKIIGQCKGKKKIYEYYTCRKKLEPDKGIRCKLPNVPQEELEWRVWQRLTSLFKNQKHFEQTLFSANAQLKKDNIRAEDVATKIMRIDRALKDIATQIENIIDFIAHGTISHDEAEKKITKLKKQEAKLSKERQKLDIEQTLLLSEVSKMKKIEETRLWWLEYSEEMEEEGKRKFVDRLIERIEVSPKIYSKEQAQKDDEYGGGPESGFETKFYIKIIGRVPIKGSNKIW